MSSYDISWKWGNNGDGRKVYDAYGYGRIYAWGEISNWYDGDDSVSFTWTVYVCGTSGGSWDGPYQYGFNLAAAYQYNGWDSHVDGVDTYYNGGTWRSNSVNITISKTNDSQELYLYLDMDSKTVNGYGGAPGAIIWDWQHIGTVWISPRTYYKHDKPKFSADKDSAHYGETVSLSWAKSSKQGNANFDRFELWQGENKLYSGSGVSYNVIPSEVTGASGGDVEYRLVEVHEWYGSYPTTEATLTINVKSGVVTTYDSDGKAHTAIVTAYDEEGKPHFVLIAAYDSDGTKHAVI